MAPIAVSKVGIERLTIFSATEEISEVTPIVGPKGSAQVFPVLEAFLLFPKLVKMVESVQLPLSFSVQLVSRFNLLNW